MQRLLATGMMVLLIGLFCAMAYGEEPNKTDSDEWRFSITPLPVGDWNER